MKKFSIGVFSLTILCFASAARAQGQTVPFQTQVRGWNYDGEMNSIPILTNAVQVSAGLNHGAALLWGGRVENWGYWASLASGEDGLSNIVSLACGELISLAINNDGLLKPWGSYLDRLNAPANLTNLVEVSVDNSTAFNGPGHQIVLKADGTVAAWGVNWGGTNLYNAPPDLTNVVAVAAGFYENLALRSDGSLTILGKIPSGNSSSYAPAPENPLNVIAISTSGSHNLALLENGKVVAWGENQSSQCDVPANLGKVAAISAGARFSLALQEDGKVVAWGDTNIVRNLPSDLRDVIAISAGNGYCLALISHELATSPPVIYAEPKNKKADLHESTYLAAYAVGLPPIRYQWLKDGQPISGATQKFLYFENLAASDYGVYTVEASNKFGSTRSQAVMLNPASSALDIALVPSVRLFGDIGASYLIQFAEAIEPTTDWQAMATITLTNSPQWYFDLSGLGEPRRFYRSQKMP